MEYIDTLSKEIEHFDTQLNERGQRLEQFLSKQQAKKRAKKLLTATWLIVIELTVTQLAVTWLTARAEAQAYDSDGGGRQVRCAFPSQQVGKR